MSKSATLAKQAIVFFLVYLALSMAFAFRAPHETLGDFIASSIGALVVLAPFVGGIFVLVAIWTLVTHSLPSIQRESTSPFPSDENTGPSVSLNGLPMRNGMDPMGNPFGLENRDHF